MNIDKLKMGNLKWIDDFVMISFFAGILVFLFFTGTLNSGYHFIDDHEMLEIRSDLGKASILGTSIAWIKKDCYIRFRPMYYVHRVLEVKLFGTDFFAISLYSGILGALTFSFFYFAARKMKYSVLESLLFVLLAFVGAQMKIWWMLGPNETIGMFFLGLSFFFMAKCTEGKKYLRNSILFVIFLIAASLSKESFIIVVPAFVFFKIWNETHVFNIQLKESLQKNILLIFPIIVMVVELSLILFVVGTNKLGYAGLENNIQKLIKGMFAIVSDKEMLGGYFALLAVVAALYLTNIIFAKPGKPMACQQSCDNIFAPMVFSFLILFPNIILYGKCGMGGKYLLPSTVGLAFLVIYMITKTSDFFLRAASIVIVFMCIIGYSNAAVKEAGWFARDGLQTKRLLSAITENARPNSKILVVADPVDRFEVSYSLNIYLRQRNINNLYWYPVTRKYNSDFELGLEKGWMQWFKNRYFRDLPGQPDLIVVIDKNQSGRFFRESRLPVTDYKDILEADNPHGLYLKKYFLSN